MNTWEKNFVTSIRSQLSSGKTLTAKQEACLNKIKAKYDEGVIEGQVERELTWKERYGTCEDAPCCGCCGQNVYGGY